MLTSYLRGESGVGNWTIIVKDTQVNSHNGTFIDWHLKLWGEAINPELATLIPLPEDTDDDNHDEISTTTLAATTTSIPVPTETSLPTVPTDHPDRPVNAKPTGTADEGTSPTSSSPASTSASDKESSWLPSFFPTFGVSAKTQIWIYGAIGLIVVFCSGLGVYFYMARRRRLRNSSRDNYEFDLVAEEEAEGLTQGGAAGGRRQKGKRRAGELYDAFAAGSEDEEDFDDFDDEDAEDDYEEKDAEDQHVVGGDDDDEEADGGSSDEMGAKARLLGK
jgi:kexin